MPNRSRVKLKKGASYRDFWLRDRKPAASDTTSVSSRSESTIEDWRKALALVLDSLRPFPEARKAADEALLRMAAERKSRA